MSDIAVIDLGQSRSQETESRPELATQLGLQQARSSLFEGVLVRGWHLLFDVAQPPEEIDHGPQTSH